MVEKATEVGTEVSEAAEELVGAGPEGIGGSSVLRIVGGAVGFYVGAMLHPTSVGLSAEDEMAEKKKLDEEQQQQQNHEQSESKEKPPEAQAASGGARKGGGRNEQKSNEDRAGSAKDNLAKAKADLAAAKKQPPSKQRSAAIRKAEQQIKHWQRKAAEKSETHSRKHKGQKK